MGLDAVLVDADGRQVLRLPDPAGGVFDAAGDFDRLLGQVSDAPFWSSLDPHNDTTLDSTPARVLLAELPVILGRSLNGAERRGLERLQTMLFGSALPTRR